MEDGSIIYAHTPVCDIRLAPGGSDFPPTYGPSRVHSIPQTGKPAWQKMMNSTYPRQSQGKDSGRLSGLAVLKEIH